MNNPEPLRVLAFATSSAGGFEEARLRSLLENFSVDYFPFNHRAKWKSFGTLAKCIRRGRYEMVIMEGTGIAGGSAVLLSRFLFGVPFVFSSGDAVGPLMATKRILYGPFFGMYERLLCRYSRGFIGWSPYLVGRAITFGARRAMSAPGWAFFRCDREQLAAGRRRVRSALGIPQDALVFGIAGSLVWNRAVPYCYGLELIRAIGRVDRPDLCVLIVGDGDGREKLAKIAGASLGKTVFLPGRMDHRELPDYLAAMDVGSLPQSLDQVGASRYTAKISEYLAAGLPIATGQLPVAYDFDGNWIWRLAGEAPWDETYIRALSALMRDVTAVAIEAKRLAVPRDHPDFDRDRQVARSTAFMNDIFLSQSH